jgi:hypothetical protein
MAGVKHYSMKGQQDLSGLWGSALGGDFGKCAGGRGVPRLATLEPKIVWGKRAAQRGINLLPAVVVGQYPEVHRCGPFWDLMKAGSLAESARASWVDAWRFPQ